MARGVEKPLPLPWIVRGRRPRPTSGSTPNSVSRPGAPPGADPIAVIYVALDTDLLFIPVFTKYVWSATKPAGTVTEGGMFSGSEIVVQSGLTPGEWVEEQVNVYEDFKRIHKHEPAEKAWGISLFASPGVDIDFGSLAASAQ